MTTDVTTLVTGAAGAIGSAMAERLDRDGHHLILLDLDVESLARRWGGSRHACIEADVTSVESLQVAAAVIRSAGLHVTHVVANVGAVVEQLGGMDELTTEAWQATMRVNLDSAFYSIKEMLPLQREASGHRAIVLMSSVLAVRGSRFSIAYSSAKAGLLGLMTSLAQDLAREGITVNAVAPAPVAKPLLTELAGPHLDALTEKVPLGRLCTPDDVANLVAHLLDSRSASLTGQAITLDGGLSSGAWWHPYW